MKPLLQPLLFASIVVTFDLLVGLQEARVSSFFTQSFSLAQLEPVENWSSISGVCSCAPGVAALIWSFYLLIFKYRYKISSNIGIAAVSAFATWGFSFAVLDSFGPI